MAERDILNFFQYARPDVRAERFSCDQFHASLEQVLQKHSESYEVVEALPSRLELHEHTTQRIPAALGIGGEDRPPNALPEKPGRQLVVLLLIKRGHGGKLIGVFRGQLEFALLAADRRVPPVVFQAQLLIGAFGEDLAEQYVEIDPSGGVTMKLPPAVITDVIMEDADTATYQYPDLEIGPEGWKKLTSFVKVRLQEEAISGEVLSLAKENGKQFLHRIFTDSGYSSIKFSE